MCIQCFAFDFTGTLANTMPVLVDVMNDLSVRYRFRSIEAADLQQLRRLSSVAALRFMGIPRWKLPVIAPRALSMLADRMDQVKPIRSDLLLSLFQLRSVDRVVGIITSNSSRNVWRFCAANQLPRLDFVQSSGIFGKARTLRRLAGRYRVKPEQIIYIGDETRDIEAARKAGVLSAAVTWGATDEAVLRDYNPDFIFSAPDEILGLL